MMRPDEVAAAPDLAGLGFVHWRIAVPPLCTAGSGAPVSGTPRLADLAALGQKERSGAESGGDESALDELAFISPAKGIGMSLDDIADLVASWPVGEHYRSYLDRPDRSGTVLLLWAIGRAVTAAGNRIPSTQGRSRHYLAGRLDGVQITTIIDYEGELLVSLAAQDAPLAGVFRITASACSLTRVRRWRDEGTMLRADDPKQPGAPPSVLTTARSE